MNKEKIRDLTTGPVARKLYRFALPIICINLLQAIYNIVDMIIVGRFIGSIGMSAVTVGGQIVICVFCIISAFSNSEAMLTGRMAGAKNTDGISKVVNSALIFAIILSVCLTAGIILASDPLLQALNVQPEAFTATKNYLIIYMSGTIFVYLYNVFYGMLRGLGESTVPMIFTIISTLVNIILDLFFVGGLSTGVEGAAFATILSQALSMIMMMVYINKKIEVYKFKLSEFRIFPEHLKPLLKIGFPQMCQFTLTQISFNLIAAIINSYGVQATAAAGASNRLYSIGVLVGQAMMASILTMTAQNLPAKNYKRIYRGLLSGIILVLIVCFALLTISQFIPGQLLGIFTSEEEVIAIGIPFLKILVWAFVLEDVMFCFFGILTGAGHTHITMIAALVMAFGARYLLAWFLTSHTAIGFNGIAWAYILAAIPGILIASLYTASGKWKKARVQ